MIDQANSSEHSSPPGRIEISKHAIATLVAETALQCYGVVGLVGHVPGWRQGWFHPESGQRGVVISLTDGVVTLDLYIVVEYGTRISEVARSLMERIAYTIDQNVGLPVAAVNVHIQDLRISS